MAKHGHLGEFEANKDDCVFYIERAKQYFAANEVTDAGKQRAILLRSRMFYHLQHPTILLSLISWTS